MTRFDRGQPNSFQWETGSSSAAGLPWKFIIYLVLALVAAGGYLIAASFAGYNRQVHLVNGPAAPRPLTLECR